MLGAILVIRITIIGFVVAIADRRDRSRHEIEGFPVLLKLAFSYERYSDKARFFLKIVDQEPATCKPMDDKYELE